MSLSVAEDKRQSTVVRFVWISALAIAPTILFLLSSGAWVRPTVGFADEWMYIGYALNLDDPDFLPDNYKLSRMPWLLTLWAFYSLFPPAIAEALIPILSLTSIGILFFLCARVYCGNLVAGFVSVFAQFYAFSLGTGGMWTYHNTLATPLYLGLFLLIRKSLEDLSGTRRWLWALLAGAAAASLVHTAVSYVFIIPLTWLMLVILRPNAHLQGHLRYAIGHGFIMAAGGLFLTAFLGFISVMLGRPFDFWRLQLEKGQELIAPEESSRWTFDLSADFFQNSTFLYLPACAAVICGAALLVNLFTKQLTIPNKNDRARMMLQIHYLVCVGVWIALHFAGMWLLSWSFYVAPIIMPALLALACVAKRDETSESVKTAGLLAAAASIAFVLPLLFVNQLRESVFGGFWGPFEATRLIVFCLPVGLVVMLMCRVRTLRIAGIVLTGLVNAMLLGAYPVFSPAGTPDLAGSATRMLHEISEFVSETRTDSDQIFRVWGDPTFSVEPSMHLPQSAFNGPLIEEYWSELGVPKGDHHSGGTISARDLAINFGSIDGAATFAFRAPDPDVITANSSRPVKEFAPLDIRILRNQKSDLLAIFGDPRVSNAIQTRFEELGQPLKSQGKRELKFNQQAFYVEYFTLVEIPPEKPLATEQPKQKPKRKKNKKKNQPTKRNSIEGPQS